MNIHHNFIAKLLTLVTMLLLAFGANAEHDKKRIKTGYKQHNLLKNNSYIKYLDRLDYAVWRSGRWYRTKHDGRLGWWWVVGRGWRLVLLFSTCISAPGSLYTTSHRGTATFSQY